MNQKPLAFEAYEKLAEAYAARIDTKAHNAYYERPATLSLVPDVQGKRVLDAGCGPGVYSEWLVAHGATVVAVDASPKMVQLARKRLGTKASVHLVNLEQPLDGWEAATFDLVLSPLVVDYISDWGKLFSEFHRLLRSSGTFIFSVEHPFAEFLLHGSGNYFNQEQVSYQWRGFGKPVWVPYYRRPLEMLINTLLDSGFILDRLLEAKPTENFKIEEPEDYEKLSRQPGFMCVRALKR